MDFGKIMKNGIPIKQYEKTIKDQGTPKESTKMVLSLIIPGLSPCS